MKPRGGNQAHWTTAEEVSLGSDYLTFVAEAKQEGKFNGMSNIAVMKGLAVLREKKYALAPGYVSRTPEQIESWHKRAKTKHREVVNAEGSSGGARKVGLPGEQLKRGMVDAALWEMMVQMFGADPAQDPKNHAKLSSASGGLSQKASALLLAQKKTKKNGGERRGRRRGRRRRRRFGGAQR